MKKITYITSFTFLGLLVATIVHAGFEMPILHFVFSDYETYGESAIIRYWDLIHGMSSAILWIIGAAVGFYLGNHYWHVLYVDPGRTEDDNSLKNP